MGSEPGNEHSEGSGDYLSRLFGRLSAEIQAEKKPDEIFMELIDSGEFPEIFSPVTYQILSSRFTTVVYAIRRELKDHPEANAEQLITEKLKIFLRENQGIFVAQQMFLTGAVNTDEALQVIAAFGRLPDAFRYSNFEKSPEILAQTHGVATALGKELKGGPSDPSGYSYSVAQILGRMGEASPYEIQQRMRKLAGGEKALVDSVKTTRGIREEVRGALLPNLLGGSGLKQLDAGKTEGEESE